MQTKMVAKYTEILYKCTKCGFKLTTRGGVYDNSEFVDKIQHKINKNNNKCMVCREGVLDLMSVICRVEPIINRNYYEIKWECKECNAQWYSIEDLNPKETDFDDKLDRIKHTKTCINEQCKSHKIKPVLLTYHRKI